MRREMRALNRFGLGARIGEAERLNDPKGWVLSQLSGSSRAGSWASDLPSLAEAGDVFSALRRARAQRDQAALAEARAALREHAVRESTAMLSERVRTERPFLERWVAFWSNHLCVSTAAKQQVAALAGHYERQAIRPHVLGRFDELVLATARHPAMLFYLDNFQSIGPESQAGRRTARRGRARGLNENYARELLELHTVGVDGGYAQDDVEALARILTGWTVDGVGPGSTQEASMRFVFRAVLHEPGDKTVLGRRYRASGVGEGEHVIRDLCGRPETARFLAAKLVRHFVSDDPPPGAVDEIAEVFTSSGGDLQRVAEALVDLPDVWETPHRKFRTPQEWIVAVLRAAHFDDVPDSVPQLLRQLRHTPWAPSSPKGYGDTRGEWADPEALMSRAELARSMSRRFVGRRGNGGLDAAQLLSVVAPEDADAVRGLLTDSSIGMDERVALAIGGPAFQWR
ncbi:MAG: DUF1800 domain-containing protein [Gemmatimonadota bacterium]